MTDKTYVVEVSQSCSVTIVDSQAVLVSRSGITPTPPSAIRLSGSSPEHAALSSSLVTDHPSAYRLDSLPREKSFYKSQAEEIESHLA